MFLAKVRVFSYENDFGNHESVNQAGDIVEIRVVELVEQEHLVGRNGAKEKRQIYRNRDKLLEFMDGLLLEVRCFGICGTHQPPLRAILSRTIFPPRPASWTVRSRWTLRHSCTGLQLVSGSNSR